MPGSLLHLGAIVLCTHAGQAQPTAPFPRVMVSGQPVVTLATPYASPAARSPARRRRPASPRSGWSARRGSWPAACRSSRRRVRRSACRPGTPLLGRHHSDPRAGTDATMNIDFPYHFDGRGRTADDRRRRRTSAT